MALPPLEEGVLNGLAYCSDPSRNRDGAWLLKADQSHRISELRAQDPGLSIPQCYERAGAAWDVTFFEDAHADRSNLTFFYFDPVKSMRRRIPEGLEMQGAWRATEDKLALAHQIKDESIADGGRSLPWSECFERAGAQWDASCMCDGLGSLATGSNTFTDYMRSGYDGTATEDNWFRHLKRESRVTMSDQRL